MRASSEVGAGEPALPGLVLRLRGAGCVFAEQEAALLIEAAAHRPEVLERLAAARVAGEPLEQLLGWVSFCGRRMAVGPGVFVPRVRTELLAEQAVSRLTGADVVVELCCGVAAVSTVLQRCGRIAELYAVDIDPRAIPYARRNLLAPAAVLLGDLYDPLPTRIFGRIDLIVANAPYVPTDAIAMMPREARDHEPRIALDGGGDGTDVQRRIIARASAWLRPGGFLLIETGRAQAEITAAEMRAALLSAEIVIDDERDATVVLGRDRTIA